jgi:NAD-dependent deacetylase
MDKISELNRMIEESDNIVFFGGAGVSTESGIPDFRSADGIYSQKSLIPPEQIISHSFFMANTDEFYEFYKSKMIYPDAKPNTAHLKLAELEKRGKLKAILTQNIDGLHQMAGSKNVFELHGSVHRNYCMKCKKSFSLDYVLSADRTPKCDKCAGIIKPDVVLYEEPLNNDVWEEAIKCILRCDMFIVGGTSLTVYPAASLVHYYKGNKLVIINKSDTSYDGFADLTINEPIAEVFSKVK